MDTFKEITFLAAVKERRCEQLMAEKGALSVLSIVHLFWGVSNPVWVLNDGATERFQANFYVVWTFEICTVRHSPQISTLDQDQVGT